MWRQIRRRTPLWCGVLLVLVFGGAGCDGRGLVGRALPLAWGGAPGRLGADAVLPTRPGGVEGTCARCRGVGIVPCVHCRGVAGRPADGYHPNRPCEFCFGRGFQSCPLCGGHGTLPGVLAASRRPAHHRVPPAGAGPILRRTATAPRAADPALPVVPAPPGTPRDDRPREAPDAEDEAAPASPRFETA